MLRTEHWVRLCELALYSYSASLISPLSVTFAFLFSLFHSHHHARRWVLLVQARSLQNQFLHARLSHISNTPQFEVSHSLPRSFQQLLRVWQRRAGE